MNTLFRESVSSDTRAILDVLSFPHLNFTVSELLRRDDTGLVGFNKLGFTIKVPPKQQDIFLSEMVYLARKNNAEVIDLDLNFIIASMSRYYGVSLNKNLIFGSLLEDLEENPFEYIMEMFEFLFLSSDSESKYIVLLRNFDSSKWMKIPEFEKRWPHDFKVLFVNIEPQPANEEPDKPDETFAIQLMPEQDAQSMPRLKVVTQGLSRKKGSKKLTNMVYFHYLNRTEKNDKEHWNNYMTTLRKEKSFYENLKYFKMLIKSYNLQIVDNDENVLNTEDALYTLTEDFSKAVLEKEVALSILINAARKYAMRHQIVQIGNVFKEKEKTTLDDIRYFIDLIVNTGKPIKDTPTFNPFQDLDLTPAEQKIAESFIQAEQIKTSFDDIGSLKHAKEEILSMLVPLKLQIFRTSNKLIRSPTGILLYGPPGTGKTMLAKALAKSAGASFIHISASTILSKWLGESEDNTSAIFSFSRKVSPTIIFLDEVDGLLHSRDSNEHESTRRVKNEFFSGWDGLFSDSSNTGQVIVVCATNRPYDLDDAALRRMPHRLLVPLPDSVARKEIFSKILKNVKVAEEWNEGDKIDESEKQNMLTKLADLTENYSGSDIKSVCVRAALQIVRDFMSQSEYRNLIQGGKEKELESIAGEYASRPITMKEFNRALKEIASSVDPKGKAQLDLAKWHKTYGHKDEKRLSSEIGFN